MQTVHFQIIEANKTLLNIKETHFISLGPLVVEKVVDSQYRYNNNTM
jgi:hypothetical protein